MVGFRRIVRVWVVVGGYPLGLDAFASVLLTRTYEKYVLTIAALLI